MVNDHGIPPEAILNPYTPLAFLSPESADNLEIIRYVHVATLAVSLLIQCNVKKNSLSGYSLIGLHVGLAHVIARGVRDCSRYGNYCTEYRLFFIEVGVIR
jgi:hypothetical protein